MELSEYLVVCRGSPPMVTGLALGEGVHQGWEPLAPATDAARPTAADVDLVGGYLYYCDVHRCVLAAGDRSVCVSKRRYNEPCRRYEIVRQRLDGTGREVFTNNEVDNCEGLAVDWIGECRRRTLETVRRGS